MSKGTSILLTLLVTLGWFWFSWKWYTCWCMQSCGCATETEEVVPSSKQESTLYPLYFQWSNPAAFQGPDYEAFKQKLLAGLADTNRLEIVGKYFPGEAAPDGFENMGLARAAQIKAMLSPPIPDEQFILRAMLVDSIEGMRTNNFESADFQWMAGERKTVEELKDRIIIRFPFGSTEKDYDPSVDDYLNKLTARIKETGETVTLTGHTDNVGDAAINLTLGDRRAKAIRDFLRKKGVPDSQIRTDSKGETQPVASNETEEGRHDNRRVEVRLIKTN